MVHAASCYLLWAHVGERAGNGSGLGDTTLGSPSGKTKVHDPNSDPGTILTHHHYVLRLNITVNDAARVAVFKCLGHLNTDVYDLAQRERAFALEPAQICSLNDRHDKE